MGQVPKIDSQYLIVGSGQMARHFDHYLNLLKISHQCWARRSSTQQQLHQLLDQHRRILLLITDSQIEDFARHLPLLPDRILIHFSGSLVTPLAFGGRILPLSIADARGAQRGATNLSGIVLEYNGNELEAAGDLVPNESISQKRT